MTFDEAKLFVRFVRFITLDKNSRYDGCVPRDSRLFFAYEGTGGIEACGTFYEMKRYSCLILPQGVEYRLSKPDDFVTYLAVNFDYSQMSRHKTVPVPPVTARSFSSEMLLKDLIPDDAAVLSSPLYVPGIKEIESSLIRAEAEYSAMSAFSAEYLSNLVKNVIIDCIRCGNGAKNRQISFNVQKIIDYVHDNLTTDLSNADIAEKFGFNPNYVSDLVKKHTGLPLHRYIIHMRIVKSLSYLEMQKYSIAEVARFCGFSDIYYFSRYFKKEIGIPPSEYRKNVTVQ